MPIDNSVLAEAHVLEEVAIAEDVEVAIITLHLLVEHTFRFAKDCSNLIDYR